MNVVVESRDKYQIIGKVTWCRESHELWITSTVPIAAPADIFLSLLLLPAMASNEDLEIDVPVSPEFLQNVPKIQQVVCSWWPKMRQVEITCPMDHSPQPTRADGKGVFFSGGVDSFHSLLRHRQDLSHLILIHGFDYGYDDQERKEQVADMATAVSKDLGKELIQISTNAREVFGPVAGWDRYHGTVLAAAGHAVSSTIGRCYIPSSYPLEFAKHHPWGSHPDLDYLWSSEAIGFGHDAVEFTRLGKIREIAHSPLVHRYLRVCWQSDHKDFNCCVCEKCMRTMLGLHITEVLERCDAFPQPLDLKRLQWMYVAEGSRPFLEEIIGQLGSSDLDVRLKGVILKALKRPQVIQNLFRHFKNAIRFIKRQGRKR